MRFAQRSPAILRGTRSADRSLFLAAVVAIAFDWIGALLALLVLKPLRLRWVSQQVRNQRATGMAPAPAR